jgi:hypothetical protein
MNKRSWFKSQKKVAARDPRFRSCLDYGLARGLIPTVKRKETTHKRKETTHEQPFYST